MTEKEEKEEDEGEETKICVIGAGGVGKSAM
jgi:GTPase SAR1 family protein